MFRGKFGKARLIIYLFPPKHYSKKNGMGIDIWEMNLKSEGWLFQDEELFEVLKIESNLTRKHLSEIGNNEEDPNFGLIPEDWTEEDYESNFGKEM